MNTNFPDIKILVTGAGGQVAQSIIKSLRSSKLRIRVIGTDCDPLSAGMYCVDTAYIVPKVNEEGYIERLINIISIEKVKLIMVGSDIELAILSKNKNRIHRFTGARVLVADESKLTIANDKWNTVEFLRKNNLPFPDSALIGDKESVSRLIQRVGFPLIIKSRLGSGSTKVNIAGNQEELDYHCSITPSAMIQEKLEPDDEEYTVGVYASPTKGMIGCMSIKRELMGGLTGKAVIRDYPEVTKAAKKIIEVLGILGPSNIQMRKTSRGPVAFEINPRFSSTTVIQSKFGFNAPEIAIRDLLFEENIYIDYHQGIALRYFDELYITDDEYKKLKKNQYLNKPKSEKLI